MSVVSQIDPAAADVSERIGLALESNQIVYFPQSPIPLPDAGRSSICARSCLRASS